MTNEYLILHKKRYLKMGYKYFLKKCNVRKKFIINYNYVESMEKEKIVDLLTKIM